MTGTEETEGSAVTDTEASTKAPRRAVERPLLHPVAAWIVMLVIGAIAVVGAFECYMLGSMYGFDTVGDRRTDQAASAVGFFVAAGAFIAFPAFLTAIYRRQRATLALVLFVLVAGGLVGWWLLSP